MSLFLVMFLITACSVKDDNEKLQVVSSFTIITDMAKEIGKEHVDIHNLVPNGTDPHEYEPLPEDIKKATDADVLFYNGMNLEGGDDGWFMKLIESTSQNKDYVFNLNEGVEPKYLYSEDGKIEEVNPHSFISVKVGIQMAENLMHALIEVDSENADDYRSNGENYINRLKEIDAQYEAVISSIPEDKRILVTSERAFQYMTESYGLKEAYIWEVDTDENGTPAQLKNLIEILKTSNPPVLFKESNVDPRPMETVSKETGIPIYPEDIYSDEVGSIGDEVNTYIKYLEHNLRIIEDGLK